MTTQDRTAEYNEYVSYMIATDPTIGTDPGCQPQTYDHWLKGKERSEATAKAHADRMREMDN
jgi:hypothetical protein